MATSQRSWRISNPLIIFILGLLVLLLSSCVSSPNLEVNASINNPTQTQESNNIQPTKEIVNNSELEISEIVMTTPTIEAGLQETPAIPEEANENLFTPLFSFPISSEFQQTIEQSYRFGSTLFGERMPHDGVEILNSLGTPVLAVEKGKVFFSGNDQTKKWGRYTNLYGNFIILEHLMVGSLDPIYTMYAHLSELLVEEGQEVSKGQIIGKVGATGKAFTNHLHFEVRVGDVLLHHARNPELFLPLIQQTEEEVGIMIGVLLTSKGNQIPGGSVVVQRMVDGEIQSGSAIYVETYAKGIISDDQWNENFVLSNLPVGTYRVSAYAYQYLVEKIIEIKPNEVTFVNLQPEE